jgi:hypothetical protein
MKSERRHELQRNTLAVEMVKVWEFLRRRGNLIAWVALGAAAIVLAVVWYTNNRARSEVELQAQFERCVLPFTQSQTPEQEQASLEKIAAEKSSPLWAANAEADLGDTMAKRLIAQWPGLGEADRLALRAQSQAYYKKVIEDFPKEPVALAKAHFGLGKLAEDWDDVETARKEYEEAAAAGGEGLKGQPIAWVIRDALGRLEQLQGTVYMPASAPAALWTASGPSSSPATARGAASSAPASRPVAAPSPLVAPAATSTPAETPKSAPAKSD